MNSQRQYPAPSPFGGLTFAAQSAILRREFTGGLRVALPEYDQYDAVGLAGLVRAGKLSAREVVDEAIARAEAVNPALNFLSHRAYDEARAAADSPQLPRGPLTGVPWLVKELASSWGGQPFTNTLPYLKDLRAPGDSLLLVVTGAVRGARARMVQVQAERMQPVAPELPTESAVSCAMARPAQATTTPRIAILATLWLLGLGLRRRTKQTQVVDDAVLLP